VIDPIAMSDSAPRFFRSNANGVAPGGHYSHAVAAGGFVFVSGQLPIPPSGAKDPSLSIREQTRLALENVRAALAAAGAKPTHVVKVVAYLTSEEHWEAFNAAYAEFFGEHRPVRAAVPCGPLHYGFDVEIEAVAWVGTGAS
jgi:2-iminobutanoate/2-iminopropanoate deaminase